MWASWIAQMVNNPPTGAGDVGLISGWEYPLEKGMITHTGILVGKILWQRSLVGYSPWGYKELDVTEQLNRHWEDLGQ